MKKRTIFALLAASAAVAAGAAYVLSRKKHGCCSDYDAGDLEDDCECCDCELDGDCPVEDLDNAEMPAVDVDDAETGEAAEAPAEDAPAEDADKSADKTEA